MLHRTGLVLVGNSDNTKGDHFNRKVFVSLT